MRSLLMADKVGLDYGPKEMILTLLISVKSKMTLKCPNVMVHEMKGTNGGKDSVCVREFFKDKMVATCKVDDVETVRTYAAV